jgi:hypothetical protein
LADAVLSIDKEELSLVGGGELQSSDAVRIAFEFFKINAL